MSEYVLPIAFSIHAYIPSSDEEQPAEESQDDGEASEDAQQQDDAGEVDVHEYRRGEPVSIVDGAGVEVGTGFMEDNEPDPTVRIHARPRLTTIATIKLSLILHQYLGMNLGEEEAEELLPQASRVTGWYT